MFCLKISLLVALTIGYTTGSSGDSCKCETSDDNNGPIEERACFEGNSTLQCSGRGSCCCGICDCNVRQDPNEMVYGRYCECDNFSCDRVDGKICGGEERGICQCGVCQCKRGWQGAACGCEKSIQECIAPNGQLCSGNGICQCGRCVCGTSSEEKYTGRYCSNCATCPSKCEETKACVQCQMYQTGPLTAEECSYCDFIPIQVDDVYIEDEDNEVLCLFQDESDDCRFTVKINEKDEQRVYVSKKKVCPEPQNFFQRIFGYLGK